MPRLPGWLAVAGLTAALAAGAALRLAWPRDIEYKADEAWTFERVQRAGVTEPFPWVGMPSSAGILNPGMSVWVFLGLGQLAKAPDPPALARSVQLLNVAALVLLVAFAWRVVPAPEREQWLWAAALCALNPFAILFHRKIWPPCVLPIFTLALLAGWWHRRHRWGAFTWGLVGACLGQVHMSGFFFAGGFAAWTLLFNRRLVAWRSWLAGSALGAVPMLPWLAALAAGRSTESGSAMAWWHPLELKFWSHWVTEPFGLGLRYTLGQDFADFVRYPLLAGRATYGVAALHGLLLVAAVLVLVRGVGHLRRAWKDGRRPRPSPSVFAQNAALWGFGGLLTGSTLICHRHYLTITFALMFVWLARLALPRPGEARARPSYGRALLAGLCASQGLISLALLAYVHENQRPIRGDYGAPYAVGHPSPAPGSVPAAAIPCAIAPAGRAAEVRLAEQPR